ncbi:MAG: hypothetical protein BZY80_03215 [SAR202 cluster bacterium Io17-Chloro-G2]|nr:MAG: hypothetical protein BZY80_03215 [SAR202 cluster bacterium Io17-Chloro-G2]
MKITAYPRFQHAGSLWGPFDSRDPRNLVFSEGLEVDLRRCEFILPPAVLWCVVYPLLAKFKGTDCTLLVPENLGVCIYLKSLGLFRILQENGVDVDDRDIHERTDIQLVLPLTRFDTVSEVEDLANQASETLIESGLGAPNLRPLVSETFAELSMNAVQHANSQIGAYGLIQFYEYAHEQRFVCVVADGGIGIRKSLENNPDLRSRVPYDWVAIELATRERISGTGDRHRSIGLYGVAEDMRKASRSLIIHSGIGSMRIDEQMESRAQRTRLFPGSLASASIPS